MIGCTLREDAQCDNLGTKCSPQAPVFEYLVLIRCSYGEDSMGRQPSSRSGSLGVPKVIPALSTLNAPLPDPEVMNNPGCKFPSLKIQLPCFPRHDGLCLPESESQINISLLSCFWPGVLS